MAMVTVEDFRGWAGAAYSTVPDGLAAACLDEAEAALWSDVGCDLPMDLTSSPQAAAIARGDVLRRAANILARRNSPEGVAGVGDMGIITVPSGDPGSPAAVRRLRRILGMPPQVVIA